ncbi:hypothetical protein GCM10009430_31900 [Aquimarina litoralis]|uniref:Nucleotidyltransferase domain-containing protein n=1 Tax=Aquimarina litoralis TaxID=584605 RepID=A0ABN1J1D3_9FLAO
MYSKKDRIKVEKQIIDFAKLDSNIIDCAIVGSKSVGNDDKWSDIDLAFGYEIDADINQILRYWSKIMFESFGANKLFDMSYKESLYRVFLLPNALQVDLSFTPSDHFGAITDNFKLIFGNQRKREFKSLPEINSIAGYTILFALKTRTSIEREKYWQAQYYLTKCRENTMILKCLKENLNSFDGRSFDELTPSFLNQIQNTMINEPNKRNLENALKSMIHILIKELSTVDSLNYKFINELEIIGK